MEHKITPEVIEDQPLKGLAATIEESGDNPELELEERLAGVSQRLGAGRPGDQGAMGELWREIISRVRGRKLVEDHGLYEVEIPWVSLHAPARGSAHLKLSRSEQGEEGIKFSLVGIGLGDGWSYKATLSRDLLERKRCIALIEIFKVRVRSYAYEHGPAELEYRSDVAEHVGTIVRELHRCPLCEPRPDDEPSLVRKAGKVIDLSGDPVGQKISESLELRGSSEFEVGLKAKVAGDLGVSAGVICKREVSFTCNVEYTLAGGYLYWPMRRLQYDDLPFWRVGGA